MDDFSGNGSHVAVAVHKIGFLCLCSSSNQRVH